MPFQTVIELDREIGGLLAPRAARFSAPCVGLTAPMQAANEPRAWLLPEGQTKVVAMAHPGSGFANA